MSQGFWKPKVGSDANIDEMAYNSTSRLDTKRSHQWFMDGPETDLPSNKKQAVGLTSNHSFLELLNSNPSQWGVASSFQTSSGHFCEQLFDLESSRMTNYDERGVPLIGTGKMDVGRKVHEDLLSDSSFALSMSHMPEDPGLGLHYGGARKVKVSQVKGPEHVMPVSIENGYNKMEGHRLFMPHTFVKNDENPISLALPSGIGVGDDRIITLGKMNGGDSSGISIGKLHGIEDKSASVGQTYGEDQNNMSISLMMGKEQHSIMSSGQGYQSDSCTMSTCHLYNQEGNSSSVSVGNGYDKTENIMIHTIGKGQSTIISFGGCDDDTNSSGRLIYNYERLMGQTSLQMLNAIGNMGLVKSNDGGQIIIPVVGDNSKKKEEHNMIKKSPSNNFPSNVRSLLSTGILDGVHVKYIAWSREELRGIIRGCGYLCGCPSCNYSKVINAYEFERHAGCKTKHPNNHIYFENGKTIYGTVQELRSTPQHMLFEVMQKITGSPINQKSFRLWKESYLAATQELQRIYDRDDERVLS